MDEKLLKEAVEGIKETKTAMQAALTAQAAEIKQFGETTAETAKKITDLNAQFDEQIKALKDAQDEMKQQFTELEAKANRLPQGGGESRKSLGEQFTESDVYKRFIGVKGAGRSDAFQVKTTLTGATLGNVPGYLYEAQRMTEIITPPSRTVYMSDLIPNLPTSSGAIEFVRRTGYTNNAGAKAEGIAFDESALTFEIVSIGVKNIGHFLPVTRQILEDEPALRGYIDTQLLDGLKLEKDRQILYGNGTGANLAGITVDSDVQTYSWSEGTVGDTKVDAIRRAVSKARLAQYAVTGVVLHENDWADIELLKGTDGHYIWVQVAAGGEMRVWRIPVVVSDAISEGTFLTGAFDKGATLWNRMEGEVTVTDSHSDWFTKGILAIKATERIALTIERPEAFVVGTFDSAPVAGSGS
jgi:HK97 family phage major capsid protein